MTIQHQHMIGIAQMKVSQIPTDTLIAPNLGSCLGIAVHDPIRMTGGLIHCLLPLSKSDPQKASFNPCTYVDTGLSALLDELLAKGSDMKKLTIVAVGGANMNDDNNVFEIGKKNITVLKKLLWKNGLLLKAESLGSSCSRTLSLEIGTGRTFVKMNGELSEI